MSTSEPPTWPHCAQGADPVADPVGCRGIHVPGHTKCLAHLANAHRDAYLAGLTPGASIDHRGTTFTASLLTSLLNALRDPSTGKARLGTAVFQSATFASRVEFRSATFEGYAVFESATFESSADFGSVTFNGDATTLGPATLYGDSVTFESATFKDDAEFRSATFNGDAVFRSATFNGAAVFAAATFGGGARFDSATFEGYAVFEWAIFTSSAEFRSANFNGNDAAFESVIFKYIADFWSATFKHAAGFQESTFKGSAKFRRATFEGNTWFYLATFESSADFGSATFESEAEFATATFKHAAGFQGATFQGSAHFRGAAFESSTMFQLVTFESSVEFGSATFEGDAEFESATFMEADRFGPLVCAGRVVLSGAKFGSPVTLSVATHSLECRRTRWSSTAEIRLRYATVDFAHAVFEYPLTIAAEPDPFVETNGQQLAEDLFPGTPDPGVRMASLRGVDAAHLVLHDLDLSGCLFAGTVHLDQLRLEGACLFNTVPGSVHWRGWRPVRFTRRRTLVEEHHWRARQPAAVPGWRAAPSGAGSVGPLQLAPVYRALRKAFEDGKHEPGAADFYYGEMEMRRHADDIPRSERSLLTAYWALSGYGLRASRALAWLGAAMLLTIVLLMAFGLAQDTPKQTATGTVPAGGGTVTFEIDKDDPQNPSSNRFTGKRFENALNVTLNSVVFRSSGQDLTTAGTYVEMVSRLSEPVLLGLAVLAVRNRVKR